MKIFINNRNYLTWPKAMAEQLAGQDHHVVFIDNGSTYDPLLSWYEHCPFQVIRLPNLGNRAAWIANIVQDLDEYYVITDPDYDLSMIPDDWAPALMEGFRLYPGALKVGLSFDESSVPPENPAWLADEMHLYPNDTSIAWAPLPGGFCNYPCDTSFAIYPPHSEFTISGIRKGRPYTGIHLPWHIVLEPSRDVTKRSVLFDDEIYYYFSHVENSSFTLSRIFPMMEEYAFRKRL